MARKPKNDWCPRCDKLAPLSGKRDGRYEFPDPLCHDCRDDLMREGEMDSFDHAYARAIANGWAD